VTMAVSMKCAMNWPGFTEVPLAGCYASEALAQSASARERRLASQYLIARAFARVTMAATAAAAF
jgi:hypothetical protein